MARPTFESINWDLVAGKRDGKSGRSGLEGRKPERDKGPAGMDSSRVGPARPRLFCYWVIMQFKLDASLECGDLSPLCSRVASGRLTLDQGGDKSPHSRE